MPQKFMKKVDKFNFKFRKKKEKEILNSANLAR